MSDTSAASAASAAPVPAGPASTGPAAAGSRTPGRDRLGAVGLVLAGALSVHSGSAVAALVFPRVGVSGVVTLRLTMAAVVLLVVCRPNIRGYARADWALIVGFGAVLAGMNSLFYQSIERIPLGAAVTLEVLGPLTLSVVTARRAASWLWALLALAAVLLLGRGGFTSLTVAGVAFALGAGVLWALYIVLSARTGSRFPKVDGLALAMGVSAVLTLPLGLIDAGTALFHPVTIALGAGVAILSSLMPYTLELLALRRLPTSTFAILMSLEPALAAVAGFLILGQALTALEGVAIVLVVVASIGAVRAATPRRT